MLFPYRCFCIFQDNRVIETHRTNIKRAVKFQPQDFAVCEETLPAINVLQFYLRHPKAFPPPQGCIQEEEEEIVTVSSAISGFVIVQYYPSVVFLRLVKLRLSC